MGRKKKFIDKKNSLHFHLVRRSQRDPLIADENSSPFVLVPAGGRGKVPFGLETDGKHTSDEERSFEDLSEGELEELEKAMMEAEQDGEGVTPGEQEGEEGRKQVPKNQKGKEKEKEVSFDKNRKLVNMNAGEAAKYGILFDDSAYDYTQHLKEMGAPGAVFIAAPQTQKPEKLNKKEGLVLRDRQTVIEEIIPKEALPSEWEEEVGMLNLAAPVTGPQPELGEDVLEVLEALEDEAFEGELDDEFIEKLDDSSDGEYPEEVDEEDSHRFAHFPYSKKTSGGNSDLDSEDEFSDEGEEEFFETRSRFTNFSMTSSVLARTKELKILDERFDQVMQDYDDEEIGELEESDPRVQGSSAIGQFENLLDEFLEEHADDITIKTLLLENDSKPAQQRAQMKEAILKALEHSEGKEAAIVQVEAPSKPAWDCETILSTYSNLENHPAMIRDRPKKKIILDKTGMPTDFLKQRAQQQREREEALRQQAEKEREKEKEKDEKKKKVVKKEVEEEEEEEEEDEEGEGEDSDGESTMSGNPHLRNKSETTEEKKERKRLVKEQKKSRRAEKKATKTAFKNEKIRQEQLKILTNASRQTVHIQ